MKKFLEPGDTAYWPYLLDPFHSHGQRMTVLDRNKIRRSYNRKDPRYHQVRYVQYLVDGLVDNLVADMHANIADDWDNLVVISGAEGTGKSNLAYHICKKFDPDFSLEDGFIYDYTEIVRKLAEKDVKGKIIWLDEATLIAGKRDWQKEQNKDFINILETYRSYGITIVMCIPDKDRLDVYIREDRLRYHLIAHMMSWESDTEKKRGYFEVQDKTGRSLGYGKFPQIPAEDKKEYERIKSEHQQEYAEDLQAKIDRKKNGGPQASRWIEIAIREIIARHDSGLSWEDLAAEYDIPASTLRRQASAYRKKEGME